MAADFGIYSYTSDKGLVYKIKLAVSNAALQNPANPDADKDVDESVQVGSNRRTLGLHARGFRCARPVGEAPNIFNRTTFLPICTQAQYAAASIGASITIGGLAYTIQKKIPEVAV
jgi:hypothetical protein